MTIWMITREHEYQGGYEDHIDETFGYFTSQVLAEDKLADLVDEEKDAHRRNWVRSTHDQWKARKAEHDRIAFQNSILKENGIADSALTPVPHVWEEPVYRGWQPSFSDYNIIAIEQGAV